MNLKDRIRQSLDNPFQTSTSTLIDQLHNKLLSSVKSQIVCDVPVGSFLSGGIDSSLITSLMQSVSPKPINTFSIGFNESSYNESCYAKNIASYLGTNHTEIILSKTDCIDLVHSLPFIWDEPFADSSQIPTTLLSQIASQSVTVALTGDGADEIFCGYNRYLNGYRLFSQALALPLSSRRAISSLYTSISSILTPFLPSRSFSLFRYPISQRLDVWRLYLDISLLLSKAVLLVRPNLRFI